MLKYLKKSSVYKFLLGHLELISLSFGSLIVSIWTMVVFFVKPSTFDLVGQQLLSRQWANGFHSGAVVGPTNYILKIIFLYMPLNHLPGSPRLKLVLLTLALNIITYILLVFIIRNLYKIFFKNLSNKFYLAAIWLATIAGSMYWINYSNSRNIEIIGGLYLVYLGLKLNKTTKTLTYILIAGLSGLVFFADPLQFYMSAIPLIIYLGGKFLFSARTKSEFLAVFKLVVSVFFGYLLSKFLSYLSRKIFGVKFIALTTHAKGYTITQTIAHGILPSFKHIAQLYTAGYQLGRFIEVLNVCFTIFIVLVGLYYAFKKLLPTKFSWFVAVFWIVNMAFYIISGQALQTGTERYLIMTIPVLILLLLAVVQIKHKLRPVIIWLIGVVIILNFIALINSLKINWDPGFSKDNHDNSAIKFMETGGYSYGYSGMYTGLPSDYLSNGNVKLLPLSCNPGGVLSTSYLFFDASYYKYTALGAQKYVPIILDGDQINNLPNICTKLDIVNQFGNYSSSTKLSDGSTVLIYQTNKIQTVLGF